MIECRGVSFSYDGAAQALDGIDLSIKDGEHPRWQWVG